MSELSQVGRLALHGSENSAALDAVIELGEEHWAMKRESKERIAAVRKRLDAIQRAA